MKTTVFGFICLFNSVNILNAQENQNSKGSMPLWAENIPGALRTADVPHLIPYLPADRSTNAAVIICPGGGYAKHAMDHEGHQVADWFSKKGIAAFILVYRLPVNGYRHPIPLLDAQRAIRLVRSRASEWQISPDKIGILGFSAGGHLASSTGTHFKNPIVLEKQKVDAIDAISCRPDFMVLVYPVISMLDELAHKGSKLNLLGHNPPREIIELMSNEKQVTADTPPTFLVHAADDKGVSPENSIVFYQSLQRARVPVEMHIFLKGGHGFGMLVSSGPAAGWKELCVNWLEQLGFLDKK